LECFNDPFYFYLYMYSHPPFEGVLCPKDVTPAI
jgi:hypothetical protein